MADIAPDEKESHEAPVMGFTVERLNALSDGVFAVAITLLAVGIALPTIHGAVTNQKVWHGLGEQWPHFFAYFLSFVIIAMFWMSHHSLFSAIQRVDKVLLWLNVFYLLLIVFMPYPTQLLALYGETAAAVQFYAAVLAAAGIFQGLMGLWATRDHRLVHDAFDMTEAGRYLRNSFFMSGIFILSIGVAFINPSAAQLCWLLLFFRFLLEWLFFRKRAEAPKAAASEGVSQWQPYG